MREVKAAPLFDERLVGFLADYAERGAVKLLERLNGEYVKFIENIEQFNEIAVARRRRVDGKTLVVRQYILDAGSKAFMVLYWVPDVESEPILLLNIKAGGQNRFKWK
jgi:hypothetical protein